MKNMINEKKNEQKTLSKTSHESNDLGVRHPTPPLSGIAGRLLKTHASKNTRSMYIRHGNVQQVFPDTTA